MFRPLSGQRGTLKRQIILLLIGFTLALLAMQTFFFFAYLKTNRQNYSIQVQETSEVVGKAVDELVSRLSKISSLLTFSYGTERLFGPESLSTKLQLYRNLQLTIDSVHSSNSAIDEIVLTDFHELCLGDCNDSVLRILPSVQSTIGSAGLTGGHNVLFLQVQDPADNAVRLVRVSYKPIAAPATEDFYTIIVYNLSDLARSISAARTTLGGYFLLAGTPRRTFFVGGSDPNDSVLRSHPVAVGGKAGFYNYPGHIVYARPANDVDWQVVGTLRTNVIWAQMASIQLPNLLMIGILVTLLFLEGWLIVRNITDPIAHMARFMKLVGSGDQGGRIDVRHRNEIGLLAHDINGMLDKIEQMTRDEVETRQLLFQARLATQQAQLAAFQSQVNPHFLYNTLDCVRSMALTQNLPEIGKMATAMVHIFRYSVKQSDQVRLRDELACITQYLTIIQIRQSNRIQVLYELEECTLDASIPKMVLQPLVENAVMHGLDHIRAGGTLTIRSKLEDDRLLLLEVEDTGVGMSDSEIISVRERLSRTLRDEADDPPTGTKSIGLKNIDRRLKLTYGDRFGLRIYRGTRNGVRVRISVPFEAEGTETANAGTRPASSE